jgi:hypothetical protein
MRTIREVICVDDIVGYGPEPAACLRRAIRDVLGDVYASGLSGHRTGSRTRKSRLARRFGNPLRG